MDQYQAEFRGIVQYYLMAVNVAHLIRASDSRKCHNGGKIPMLHTTRGTRLTVQQFSPHMTQVGTLIGALGLCLIPASLGCSNGSQPNDSQDTGRFDYAAIGDGPHPPPDLGLLDTQGLFLAGAEGRLSYDPTTHAFTGKVENTTTAALRHVRVVIHLSNGTKLASTVSVNLAPGQLVDITIPVSVQPFTHWSAYLEVG